MTVGELANVRHQSVTSLSPPQSLYRIDLGELELDPNEASYLKAVALLASLGDWVTVRSHVFTVYGTLRGETDASIINQDLAVQERLRKMDVDSRALRFQETLDRLPTLLGRPRPARIGERVLTGYNDMRND